MRLFFCLRQKHKHSKKLSDGLIHFRISKCNFNIAELMAFTDLAYTNIMQVSVIFPVEIIFLFVLFLLEI